MDDVTVRCLVLTCSRCLMEAAEPLPVALPPPSHRSNILVTQTTELFKHFHEYFNM